MLSWIDIDAAALRHNYRQFCRIAGKTVVAPVLKANAYGHGLAECYRALAPEQPPWLTVNYLTEAAALRDLGYAGRILVVGPAVARELPAAEAARAEIVIGNFDVLKAWLARPAPCPVHVKIDTGMSRQGFLPSEAPEVAKLLAARKDKIQGLSTHFANVEDVTDHGYATQQLNLLLQAKQVFSDAGFKPLVHAASSASHLILAPARFDLARVGIALYGFWPSPLTRVSYLQLNSEVLELKPVLSWRTEVTTVKPVNAGQFIGYGCTYRALRDMRIAVLPVGYYEGFPRLAGDSPSFVLIRGQRCPVVGRICMNMMMVDTTHLAAVAVGDPVTLIGKDGTEVVSAQELANWAETIHYEIVTRLNSGIPRRLVGL